MRYVIIFVIPLIMFAQHLPHEWSQSYGTYDTPAVLAPGHYSIGFSIDNYTFYVPDTETDSVSYDTRRFSINGQFGLIQNTELEIKYAYPTNGIISLKYYFLPGRISLALKLGLSYMKGTREGFITDYVIDIYPTILIDYKISEIIVLYGAPKVIYSVHIRDIQEHSDREPRHIFQYGPGIGMSVGKDFSLFIESNWLWGNNQGVISTVNQFGVGIQVTIR